MIDTNDPVEIQRLYLEDIGNAIRKAEGSSGDILSSDYAKRILGLSLKKRYSITASTNPQGKGIVEGVGSYQEGTIVTLRAKPNSGYTFMCWKDSELGLPDNYLPLDYISTSGSRYINIGPFETNYRIVIDCEMGSTTGNCFGTITPKYFLLAVDSSMGLGINYYSSGFISFDSDKTVPKRIKADIDSYTDKATINGITKDLTAGTKQRLPGLTLFARGTINTSTGQASSVAQYCDNMKLYSCQIYENTDTLVHDFIPCFNSLEAGLYDKIEDKFYGSNTSSKMEYGDFVNNQQELTFQANKDKHFICALQGRLPFGYTELEYIESLGGTYLNTGLKIPYTYRMELDVEVTEIPESVGYILYGFNNTYVSSSKQYRHNYTVVQYSSDGFKGRTYTYYNTSSVGPSISGLSTFSSNATPRRLMIKINNSTNTTGTGTSYIEVDGVTKTYTGMYTNRPTGSYRVLGSGSGSSIKGKIYSMKWYLISDNSLQDDLVPCINPEGIVGMYDVMANTFCTSGIPEIGFIAGPKV